MLVELASRLAAAQAEAYIRVVGGAAIALMTDQRRTTRDIDCVILPGGVADDVLVSMTLEHDLDQGWLNDSAKAFIPAVGLED